MKKKSKIDRKQKMFPSDLVIDAFIEQRKEDWPEELFNLMEIASKELPEAREFGDDVWVKDNLKEDWLKELGDDNNFIRQYVSREDIQKLFLAYEKIEHKFTRTILSESSKNFEKADPNEATIRLASLIRDFKKIRIETKNDEGRKMIGEDIKFAKADLDYFKIKAEHFEKTLNSKRIELLRKTNLTENEQQIKLEKETTEFVNGVNETKVLDLNDKPRFNLKKEVTEFAQEILDKKPIDINDKYFVRDAMKKFIAELSKRPYVKLSLANRESIRTYLSKFKSNYIREKKRGKRKKK